MKTVTNIAFYTYAIAMALMIGLIVIGILEAEATHGQNLLIMEAGK